MRSRHSTTPVFVVYPSGRSLIFQFSRLTRHKSVTIEDQKPSNNFSDLIHPVQNLSRMKNVAKRHQEIERWLRDWENCIRKADYKSARNLFDPNVFSFGTYTFVADGLVALEEQQWRHIWSFTSGFQFDIPSAQLRLSEDHSMAIVMVSWSSTGYDENKLPLIRKGRASIVLTCQNHDYLWRAIHTHFSLYPCPADSRSAAQTHSIKE